MFDFFFALVSGSEDKNYEMSTSAESPAGLSLELLAGEWMRQEPEGWDVGSEWDMRKAGQ